MRMIRAAFIYAGSGLKALVGGLIVGGLACFIGPLTGFLTLLAVVLHDVYKSCAGEGTVKKRAAAGLLISLLPAAVAAVISSYWLAGTALLPLKSPWWQGLLLSLGVFAALVSLGAAAGALSPKQSSCDSPM